METLPSFPESFSFYHLGEVRPASPDDLLREQATQVAEGLELDPNDVCISFQLQGDLNGLFLVMFDKSQDLSAFTELANTLASQLATRLGVRHHMDVMISPPRRLEQVQLDSLAKSLSATRQDRRTYFLHSTNQSRIPVETVLITSDPELNPLKGVSNV